MADVEVFKYVHGQPIEKVIASTREAQDGIEDEARKRGAVAAGVLRAHRHEGHSKIVVESGLSDVSYGHLDRFVVLDDTRGLFAALGIEYGHAAYTREDGTVVGASEGVHALGTAFPEVEALNP